MPPVQLQYESKDAIPEDAQEDFVAFKDGDKEVFLHKDLAEERKQRFRVQGDLTELSRKNQTVQDRLEELESERKEREEQERNNKNKKLEDSGQYKEILEDEKRRHGETKAQYEDRIKALTKTLQDKELSAVIAQVQAKAPEKSRKEIGRIAKLDFSFNEDGDIVVLDEDGKATSQSVEDYLGDLPNRYPSLVAAVQSKGGQANGGRGGSSDSQKTISRSEFDGLSQTERASFFKSGGKVSD